MSLPADTVIETLVEQTDDGLVVRSPRVGIYRHGPRDGRLRTGGDEVGNLTVLNHRLTLVLPPQATGLVAGTRMTGATTAVEYGEELFTLAPQATKGPAPARGRKGKPATRTPGSNLPEGMHTVTSPIDGVFYRSPSPGAPPFVEVGQEIRTGQTIGLIEAMKSFNAVTYGGPGLPSTARVEELRTPDASETRQGAVLLVVSPLTGK